MTVHRRLSGKHLTKQAPLWPPLTYQSAQLAAHRLISPVSTFLLQLKRPLNWSTLLEGQKWTPNSQALAKLGAQESFYQVKGTIAVLRGCSDENKQCII